MSNVRKYIVVPSEQVEDEGVVQQFGGSRRVSNNSKTEPKQKAKRSTNGLLRHLLQIAIKLAKIDAFEIDGRIRSIEGKLLDGTNVIDLLDHVSSPRKALHGLDEFIKLLFKAGVEPDMILNRDVKIELMKLYQTSTPMGLYHTSITSSNAGDISTTSSQAIESKTNEISGDANDEPPSDFNESRTAISSPDPILPASVSRDSQNWIVPEVSLQNSRIKKKKINDAPRRSNRSRKERFIIYGSNRGKSNVEWIEQ